MMSDSKIDSCIGCGAQVSSFVTYCPFCGLDMMKTKAEPFQEKSETQKEDKVQIPVSEDQENLASLYNPPYVARDKNGIGVGSSEEEKKEAVFKETFVNEERTTLDSSINLGLAQNREVTDSDEKKASKGYLIPMSLMLMGSQFLTLSLLIALFSNKGFVTLEWKTSTSFFLFIMSIPLLTLGFKWLGFSKKDDKKDEPVALDIRR